MFVRCAVLLPLILPALGCSSLSKAGGAALAVAATLAVHATAAVIQEAAKGPHHGRNLEGTEERAESLCEQRRREWLELRLNPREEVPERLNCRPNGDFGTTGGVVDAHPGSDEVGPRPAATAFYPSL